MALITATNILSKAHQCARELVASSATFQTVTGAANEAAALSYVHSAAVFNPTRPYATVGFPNEDLMGVRDVAYSSGSLRVGFEFAMGASYVPTASDTDAQKSEKYQNGIREFSNNVGAIREEMMLESRNGGRLLVQSMQLLPPGLLKNDPKEEMNKAGTIQHYYFCFFLISYGVRQL